MKTVFAEKDRDQAHARWREFADSLRDRFRDVAELMDKTEHEGVCVTRLATIVAESVAALPA